MGENRQQMSLQRGPKDSHGECKGDALKRIFLDVSRKAWSQNVTIFRNIWLAPVTENSVICYIWTTWNYSTSNTKQNFLSLSTNLFFLQFLDKKSILYVSLILLPWIIWIMDNSCLSHTVAIFTSQKNACISDDPWLEKVTGGLKCGLMQMQPTANFLSH